MIDNSYLRLEQITYTKIKDIQSDLNIQSLILNMDIHLHPKIKLQEERVQKFNQISKLELENERGDYKVNIAYFNRDSKYKDYANISVNIPLSLYKSEKIKARKAKLKTVQINDKLKDIKQEFKTKVLILQNNINNASSNYKVIQKTIIPLKRKMQKNIENYNSLKGLKSQIAIQNLNELISYEIKAIDEKMKFFSNYSKSKYYIQKAK